MGVQDGQDPERRRVVVRDVEQPDLDTVQRLGEVDHADAQTHLDFIVVIEEAYRSPVYLVGVGDETRCGESPYLSGSDADSAGREPP